jgi:hypothetical protein
MASTLKIEIETSTEKDIYPLLQHVFREITEGQCYNNPTNNGCKTDNNWLIVNVGKLQGKYYWAKSE